MDKGKTITITLPGGDKDTLESIESRPIKGCEGVYEVLLNEESNRLVVDLSVFENTEEDLRRLCAGVAEGFALYHGRKMKGLGDV